jgi:biotin-dependent carboxylase-like uncharacterized protein
VPAIFHVRAPGLLSTIQDAGRPDAAPLGVPRSGACDPWSLAVANLLAGNDPGGAALEMTLIGPELEVLAPCTIALAGADLGARDLSEDRALVPGTSYRLRAGSTLSIPGGVDAVGPGVRAYLAVGGGFDVPQVLGSASTCLAGAFGGFDGRALRAGDRLSAPSRVDMVAAGARWPGPSASLDLAGPIRLLAGPHGDRFPPEALDALVSSAWTVSVASDRMGLRLDGQALELGTGESSGEMVSIPVTWGAIQVPAGGRPIVLLADHQTVGGYPVIGCVISADLSRLGQLAAADDVRFTWSTVEDARDAYRSQRAALAEGARSLRRGDAWDQLVEVAEG